jgi:hypothetical protein
LYNFSLSTIVHARSRNHSCRGKAVSIKHYEFVSAFLHLSFAVSYCHLWPVRLYDIFPHNLINGTIFVGGGSHKTYNVYLDFLYKCLKYF